MTGKNMFMPKYIWYLFGSVLIGMIGAYAALSDSLLKRVSVKKILPTIHEGDGISGSVFISDLSPDSVFYRAGSRKGDMILSVNDTRVRGYFDVEDLLIEAKEHKLPIAMTLLRCDSASGNAILQKIQVPLVE